MAVSLRTMLGCLANIGLLLTSATVVAMIVWLTVSSGEILLAILLGAGVLSLVLIWRGLQKQHHS